MKGFLTGVIVTLVAIVAGTYMYFSGGHAPVATAAPPMPFERLLARMALRARVQKEMPRVVPIPVDEQNLIAGAQTYMKHCAVCHGVPEQPQTAIAKGMFPKPTEMFKGKGVTDDPPGENYWKAYNGIRLSGMPAFRDELSMRQIWQVALLLSNADKLSPAVKAVLQPPAPASPPPQKP